LPLPTTFTGILGKRTSSVRTRGWTRFERDVYQRAADLLGASTTKLPNDPVTGYDTNDDFVTRVNTIGTPG